MTSLLLPHQFKKPGWFILIPAALAGILISIMDFDAQLLKGTVFAFVNDPLLGEDRFFSFIKTDLTNTVVGSLFIIGGLLVGFSREKKEDEYIAKLRLTSLLWAVWVSYILLLLAFLFIYGAIFFSVMVYNMFTVLIIFIIRFNFLLYKNSVPAYEK
jgi:hypothetical protein